MDSKGAKGPFKHTGQPKKLSVKVNWEPNAFVALQLIDHAVLVLNDRTHLTPRRVDIKPLSREYP